MLWVPIKILHLLKELKQAQHHIIYIPHFEISFCNSHFHLFAVHIHTLLFDICDRFIFGMNVNQFQYCDKVVDGTKLHAQKHF